MHLTGADKEIIAGKLFDALPNLVFDGDNIVPAGKEQVLTLGMTYPAATLITGPVFDDIAGSIKDLIDNGDIDVNTPVSMHIIDFVDEKDHNINVIFYQ